MENSGVSAYLRLRDLDPVLCRDIVKFAEQVAVRHNLQPAVAVDMKQALCQFAVDLAIRRATRDCALPEAARRRVMRMEKRS